MKPYISFVVVGRNDNYGYKFLERFQNFLNNLTYLCENYSLPSELIIVEWNPPVDRKTLYEDLFIQKKRKYLKLRFIEVPSSIHKKIDLEKKFPLFEYIGKNVGIRKAEGEFILCTNPDIIFSEEMIKLFSEKKLEKGKFYRANRYDLNKDIPGGYDDRSILKFCEKEWNSCCNARFGGYPRNIKRIVKIPRIVFRELVKLNKEYSYLKYHGGTPGDFMLLSKEDWLKFSGYPELKVHAGLDGYGCILAISSGSKMKILHERIYHQAHERPVEDRPVYNFEEYILDAKEMLKTKKPKKYNCLGWGLLEYKLTDKKF